MDYLIRVLELDYIRPKHLSDCSAFDDCNHWIFNAYTVDVGIQTSWGGFLKFGEVPPNRNVPR